jgi:hypothetical protein
MDAATLRALQAPLKQKYRDSPESARIVAHAEVVLDPSQIGAKLSGDALRVARGPMPALRICCSKHWPRAPALPSWRLRPPWVVN